MCYFQSYIFFGQLKNYKVQCMYYYVYYVYVQVLGPTVPQKTVFIDFNQNSIKVQIYQSFKIITFELSTF